MVFGVTVDASGKTGVGDVWVDISSEN